MKDPIPSLLLLTILTSVPHIHAWGNMGHQTVAYIASNFLTSKTKTYCETLLSDTSASFLATPATWADTYRYTSEGSFSYPWHFIDANDKPLSSSCSVSYDRDCGDTGCSVSAINNYTNILVAAGTKPSKSTDNIDALKFLIHFIGDLHQPLHDEAYEVGGNEIAVTYGSETTNLHHIWDTEILEQLAGGSTIETALAWSKTLTTRIKTGNFSEVASDWIEGADVSDPVTTVIAWAQEANAYVCDEVLTDGLKYIEGQDLSGHYYETAVPVVELQIARAGYRLAAWLNLIVGGTTGL